MAFYYEVTDMTNGKTLGGGAVQDIRPDHSRVDHEAIFDRVWRKWQKHHPLVEIHIEEMTAEQYGPTLCGLPLFNVTD